MGCAQVCQKWHWSSKGAYSAYFLHKTRKDSTLNVQTYSQSAPSVSSSGLNEYPVSSLCLCLQFIPPLFIENKSSLRSKSSLHSSLPPYCEMRKIHWTKNTLYYETLEHIYIVLALWNPDDMCHKKQETNIYVLQNVARLIYWCSGEQSLKLNTIIMTTIIYSYQPPNPIYSP